MRSTSGLLYVYIGSLVNVVCVCACVGYIFCGCYVCLCVYHSRMTVVHGFLILGCCLGKAGTIKVTLYLILNYRKRQ